MRRIVATVAAALLVTGCGVQGAQVPLLTGEVWCYAGGETGGTGELVRDPQYGTRFGEGPVMWPTGYTARDTGGAVVVLDAQGNVKATTGRRYHISHALAPSLQVEQQGTLNGKPPGNTMAAAVECDYPWDFIDCTANPGNEYCKPG